MKHVAMLASFLFLVMHVSAAEAAESGGELQFDQYWMVFLLRPESPVDYGEARNKELQREHLAHLGWLGEQGHALVGGPFGGNPEDELRGIVLLRGDLEEERARELASMDPRVEAGQLRVEIRKWYTDADALAFPLQKSPSDQ